MSDVTLDAQRRDGNGTKAAADLRRTGLVPAVVYGAGRETQQIAVCAKEMGRVLHHHGKHAEVKLALDGVETPARVVEVQREPVSRALLHLDFQALAQA
jgi:large subunit ribosomal protein L25